jgi:Ras-related protein Rab-1A
MTSFDDLFKIILVGDSAVGKTSLIVRFVNDFFSEENFKSTLGVDFRSKIISVRNKTVKLVVTDTSGAERFRTLSPSFYRGAHGILLCCDVNDPESVENLERWHEESVKNGSPNVRFVVVGCKSDVGPVDPKITQKLNDFCELHNLQDAFITSAKTGSNVSAPFEEVANALSDPAVACGLLPPPPTEKTANDKTKKSGNGFFGLGKFF